VYIDDLLVQLAHIGVGCFIGRKFVGALAYADDIVLVAPTASALCKMLAVCDNYATEYYMAFNVHKSKCMVLLPSVCRYLARELGKSPTNYTPSGTQRVFISKPSAMSRRWTNHYCLWPVHHQTHGYLPSCLASLIKAR